MRQTPHHMLALCVNGLRTFRPLSLLLSFRNSEGVKAVGLKATAPAAGSREAHSCDPSPWQLRTALTYFPKVSSSLAGKGKKKFFLLFTSQLSMLCALS